MFDDDLDRDSNAYNGLYCIRPITAEVADRTQATIAEKYRRNQVLNTAGSRTETMGTASAL